MDARFLRLSTEMMLGEDATETGVVSNDPQDPGGLTRWGISQRSYPDLDIANLTRSQALEIYYRDWYLRYHYDQIESDALVEELLDVAVTNPSAAHRALQRAVAASGGESLVVDGGIGPDTLRALNTHPCPGWLLAEFRLGMIQHYLGCGKQRFLAGWVRRAVT